MSIAHMPTAIVRKIDIIYQNFLWNGREQQSNFKTLAKWSQICRPRVLGGLRIINLKVFNQALLTKWWDKLYSDH